MALKLAYSSTDTAETGVGLLRRRGDVGTTEVAAAPVGMSPAAISVSTSRLMTLQNLGGGRVLVHPLYVNVEHLGGEYVASSMDLALFATGESDVDALEALRADIAELFDVLSESRAELGPLPLEQLAFLERLAGQH
jgi:hypothetical protein